MKNTTLAVPRPAPRRRGLGDWIQGTTSDTFAKLVLEGEGPIAVEFMSYGCAHCQIIEPVLQQVAAMVNRNKKSSESILLSNQNSQNGMRSRVPRR